MTASLLAPARPGLAGAGLTPSECYAIAVAARGLSGRWDVQWDRDDREHVSIALLQHDVATDAAGVFLIWREHGQLQCGMGWNDRYVGLGTHPDVDSVMHAVRRALEQLPAT